jgi:hypothetical protein
LARMAMAFRSGLVQIGRFALRAARAARIAAVVAQLPLALPLAPCYATSVTAWDIMRVTALGRKWKFKLILRRFSDL